MEEETRAVLREVTRTHIWVRRFLGVTIAVVLGSVFGATYTGHQAALEVRHQCSGSHVGLEIGKLTKNILDEESEQKRGIIRRTLDKVIPPITKEMSERQREAIARIILKNVEDGKTSLCPDVHILEKMKIGFNTWRGKHRSEKKYVEGSIYARDAIAGKYKYPWPEEWACVNNYQAKWSSLKKPIGTPVADLGGMKLYCQDGTEKKCSRWNPRCKD